MKIAFPVLAALLVLIPACSTPSEKEMDRFVSSLMKDMSIEEKIGQLNLQSAAGFVSAEKVTTEDENRRALESGMLGALYGSFDTKTLREAQEMALKAPHHIPLFFGYDIIHGHQTIFPVPLALSTSWNMDLIEKSARIAAREATAQGINWVFSPMVDIARDPRWGRIVEGSGEDPFLGGEIAKAMVRGYQGEGFEGDSTVMACVKHFALYGAAEAGRDYNTVDMSRQRALNEYLYPYEAAAQAGAASYMSSFNEFEGVPATGNHYLLTELLRDSWGFDGFVVSDATAIKEMQAHGIGDLQEVSATALQAGLDMDMNSNGFVGTLKKSLEEGRAREADIDLACRRILEAKYRLGLFENPFKYFETGRESEVYSPAHKAAAREIAAESQVLLKNNGVLPLRKDARVAVIGPFADAPSEMAGTWSMSSHLRECVSIIDGMRDVSEGSIACAAGSWMFNDPELEETVLYGLYKYFVPGFQVPPIHPRGKQELLCEALAAAAGADVIVACVGEPKNMNGEGASRTTLCLPDAQEELLKALKATGKPVVMVLTTGRPLTLGWEEENMDAILCTWALGTEAGHAIADVLYGDVNPSGKLTTTFPRSLGQVPLYYNHKNTGRPHGDTAPYVKFRSNYIDEINAPLYPFGFGLSYTGFEYGEPVLSSAEIGLGDEFTVSVEVRNTGTRAGKETVQLYIHDIYGSTTRPVKSLRAFRKICLEPGESRKVVFQLSTDDLRYWNAALENVCEPGDFEIMTGPNSRDVKTVLLSVR
jgi:beta-glucosidase